MASSQIEIVSAASPSFGCILRDHNQRDRFRENGNGSSGLAFQKNIKEFVRDLHACSSSSSSSSISINDQNSARPNNPNASMTPNGLRRINARLEKEQEHVCLVRSAGNSPSMGGASSLVQMWEARMNRSHSFNQNTVNSSGTTSSSSSSRTNSGMSNTECGASEPKKPEIEMEAEETETVVSESASESERVRVADIIKRLTKTSSGGAEEQGGSSSHEPSRESSPDVVNPALSSTASSPMKITCSGSPRVGERSSLLDQQQQSSPRETMVALSNLPRLRGRQAIQDLLMQMERDRQSEISSLVDRKAVSKFSQKGRIQSMLRLKVLQRGLMPPQDHLLPSLPARPKGTSSSIAARRSRFDPEAESQSTSKPRKDESSSRSIDTEVAADSISNEVANPRASSSRPLCQENAISSQCGSVKSCFDSTTPCKEKEDSLKCHKQDAAKSAGEVGSSSASMQPALCYDSLRPEATTAPNPIRAPSATEEQPFVVPPMQQQRDSDVSEYMPEMGSYVTWEDPCFGTNEGSCWDGNESMTSADEYNSQHCAAESSCYYDWFSDICRPRRYWEDRRQAWYQEVLETTSEDAEIRQLLERKTVSSFLDSSFRHRMDQLMMSRLGQQARPAADDDYPERQDRTNQVMMRFFCHGQLSQSDQQEQDGQSQAQVNNVEQVDQEEEEDDGNVIGSEYNEVSSYFEQNPVSPQLPLPSPMSSSTWSSFREPELSEESEQAGSNQPHRSLLHYTNIRTNPILTGTNATSLEMELIYDLKGHMEQLYQEMTELRKSIKCCMDMQATLHQSFKQQRPAGVEYATKKPENNGIAVNLKKGSCCICYEMPVDSLLYRCGHMCTCLKCAQELQWSSGRCPICRAPIMDVVRAYTD